MHRESAGVGQVGSSSRVFVAWTVLITQSVLHEVWGEQEEFVLTLVLHGEQSPGCCARLSLTGGEFVTCRERKRGRLRLDVPQRPEKVRGVRLSPVGDSQPTGRAAKAACVAGLTLFFVALLTANITTTNQIRTCDTVFSSNPGYHVLMLVAVFGLVVVAVAMSLPGVLPDDWPDWVKVAVIVPVIVVAVSLGLDTRWDVGCSS